MDRESTQKRLLKLVKDTVLKASQTMVQATDREGEHKVKT